MLFRFLIRLAIFTVQFDVTVCQASLTASARSCLVSSCCTREAWFPHRNCYQLHRIVVFLRTEILEARVVYSTWGILLDPKIHRDTEPGEEI